MISDQHAADLIIEREQYRASRNRWIVAAFAMLALWVMTAARLAVLAGQVTQ